MLQPIYQINIHYIIYILNMLNTKNLKLFIYFLFFYIITLFLSKFWGQLKKIKMKTRYMFFQL